MRGPDHLGAAEIAGGRVIGAAKGDCADVAFFAGQRLSAHYSGAWIEAFCGLASSNAVTGGDERQRGKIGDFSMA